jgi:hypothetical protein
VKRTLRQQAGTPRRKPSFILLGLNEDWQEALGIRRAILCKSEAEIRKAIAAASTDSIWISGDQWMTDLLLCCLSESSFSSSGGLRRGWGTLLMLEPLRPFREMVLRALFQVAIGESPHFTWLPQEQLREVLASSGPGVCDLFIGGEMDQELGVFSLARGDFRRIAVRLSIFRPSADASPDFSRFELDDYGQTIRFGRYEASAHSILFEADPDYRKRAKARWRAEQTGFGASLRRLRVLRGIPQDALAGIPARTIGRIERGEVRKPRGRTFERIAKALRVAPKEIELY